MKKFRQRLFELKEGFLDAKIEGVCTVICCANVILIFLIYLVINWSSTIFFAFNLEVMPYIILAITTFIYAIFVFNPKAFELVIPVSTKIVSRLFGRYGRVITKKDWDNIKKKHPLLYKEAFSKVSYGHCYFYSWAIATHLEDAKLMYCSIKDKDGNPTAHAVIVKNNCVYCTNARQHHDLEEYKEILGVNVYKMFSEKEYRTMQFFDNIRDDFVKWCAERNVYCDPQ